MTANDAPPSHLRQLLTRLEKPKSQKPATRAQVDRVLALLEERQDDSFSTSSSSTRSSKIRRKPAPSAACDRATQTQMLEDGVEQKHGLLTPSTSDTAFEPSIHSPVHRMPDTPETPPSTSASDGDRGDLVDATRRDLSGADDILAFVQRIKEGQERDRQELSEANNGRRMTVTHDFDKDGNQYEGRHTSLSPLTERTEQSTTAGSRTTSGIGIGRRTMPAHLALARGLGIRTAGDESGPPLPDKFPIPRSSSPTKHAVAPDLARRLQAFGSGRAANPTVERPDVVSSRSTGDLIRLFDHDVGPPSPDKATFDRPPSHIQDRGRPEAPSPLPNLRPSLRKDYSPTHSKASSVISAESISLRSFQQPLTGELFYAPSPSSSWIPTQARLERGELKLDYVVEGVPQTARFELSASRKVESVRMPPHLAQEQGHGHVHVFQIVWRDMQREPTRLACSRGVDRVEWLTRMMDVAASSVASSPAVNRFQDPIVQPHSPTPSAPAALPGRVPGWDVPVSQDILRPPSALPSEISTAHDPSLFDPADTESIRHRKLQHKLDDLVGPSRVVEEEADVDLSEQPPLDLFELDRRLEHSKSVRSIRSQHSVDEGSDLPLVSPPLPPLPLKVAPSITSNSLDRRSLMTSTTASSGRSLPRIALHNSGPTRPSGSTTPPPTRRRGAWSDVDRKSVQTDGLLLGGYKPSRAVARDIHKLLNMFDRQDSLTIARSNDFKPRLDEMQKQLVTIQARLRNQRDNDEVSLSPSMADEPTIADKVDYMLSLCNILMESHKEMSRDVETALKSKGVTVEAPKAAQSARIPPPSALRPDASILKAAALNRIEDLLITVLGRLDSVSPEDSPKQGRGSRGSSKEAAGDATPRALTPKPATPHPTISTVRSSELEAEAQRWRGAAPVSSRPELPQPPQPRPASMTSDDSVGPRHQARVAEQRAWTQTKLEAAGSARPNEASHWSATTQDPLGLSRPISSAPATANPSPPVARNMPQPVAQSAAALGARFRDNASAGSLTPTPIQPVPPPVDERMQLILQGILQALQQQQENSDTSTKQQSDVVAYLARVDNFLREDISSRSIEWQTITETLNAVRAAVDALPAHIAASAPAHIAAAVASAPAPTTDGLPADPTTGASLTQRPSLLRRMRGSAPPADQAEKDGKPARKRSLSMPRIAGPRNIRLWGGPTPTGVQQQSGWHRKPPKKGSDPATEASAFEFDTVADAHAAFGYPQQSESQFESYPMPPMTQYARSSVGEKYMAPGMPPPVGPISPDPGTPSSAGDSALAQQNLAAMSTLQTGIKEVIAHLRERASKDEERDRLAQEESRRAKEPSPMEKQRLLDAKAAEIRDAAKESKLDQLIESLKKRSEEHDNLLKKIAEANAPKPPGEKDKDDPKSPTPEDGMKVLDNIRSGFDLQVRDFKQSLSAEVRTMLTEVGALRDQKKTLQTEIAELFAFKAKHGGGAPDFGLPAYQAPKPDSLYTGAQPTFKPPAVVNSEGRRNFGPFGGGGPRGPR